MVAGIDGGREVELKLPGALSTRRRPAGALEVAPGGEMCFDPHKRTKNTEGLLREVLARIVVEAGAVSVLDNFRRRGLPFRTCILLPFTAPPIQNTREAFGGSGSHPRALSVRSPPKRGFASRRPTGKRKRPWRCRNSPCVSCWKRRPLRPPDAPLEPEDGALHLRLARQYPHHRPFPVHAAAAPGPGEGARSRRLGRTGAVRRHQAPGLRSGRPAAKRCAQYYVNHRWLGGTLTNWRTISASIARLRELEGVLDGDAAAAPRRSCCSSTANATSSSFHWAASRTWAAFPT